MRERTRSNCGRRYPSTLVAKVEGGETTQGLGTTRHWWRLWLLAHGYSVCARMCRDQRRRLLSSPRFGTPLADLPLFKIGKVVERGCPSPSLGIPPFDDIDIDGDRLYSWWPCSVTSFVPGCFASCKFILLFLTDDSLDGIFFFFFFTIFYDRLNWLLGLIRKREKEDCTYTWRKYLNICKMVEDSEHLYLFWVVPTVIYGSWSKMFLRKNECLSVLIFMVLRKFTNWLADRYDRERRIVHEFSFRWSIQNACKNF